jgi:uncharacterized protein with FMN-binding domain
MRRSPLVLTSTVLGTVAALMFRPHEPTLALSSGSSSTSQPATVTQSGDSTVATGSPINSQFGTTQVKVTIKGGKITDVQAVKINDNEPESVQISNGAIPTLRAEVLSKQTAAVDSVSGATITSQAYEASLQSALDKAGFKAPDGSTASTQAPTETDGHGRHGGGGFGDQTELGVSP